MLFKHFLMVIFSFSTSVNFFLLSIFLSKIYSRQCTNTAAKILIFSKYMVILKIIFIFVHSKIHKTFL